MIKRYKHRPEGYADGDCEPDGPWVSKPSGEWVKHKDIQKFLDFVDRYDDDLCGDNESGDCGLCGLPQEHPQGELAKFEDLERFLRG